MINEGAGTWPKIYLMHVHNKATKVILSCFPEGRQGYHPKQLQKQMRSMGIDVHDIEDVKQVIIRTATKEIVFNDAQVTVMDARGMSSYQVVGTPEERPIQQAAIGVPRRPRHRRARSNPGRGHNARRHAGERRQRRGKEGPRSV